MNEHFDCIVAGGGLAGACAAYHLARLGYEVAVLEKTPGPHHKVCGEFVSFEALSYLEEMGISLDESPLIQGFRLYSPRSQTGFMFPQPGRGISRFTLDEALLAAAQKQGARILRGVSLRNYISNKDLFNVHCGVSEFSCRHLFIATGKHDVKQDKRHGTDEAYLGLKAHLRLQRQRQDLEGTISLFSFPGGYGGVCPIDKEVLSFCFIVDKELYKSLKSDGMIIRFIRSHNPYLDSILEDAPWTGSSCAIGHLPYGFVRKECKQNVYYLGDQCAVIPSLAGDGMAIALKTAKDCVVRFHNKSVSAVNLTSLRSQIQWALFAHRILTSAFLTEIGIGLSKFLPLLRMLFYKTRLRQVYDPGYTNR